ncbi:hypothetical protein FisN_3Lh585 [Fistulifera solaris]|uniref:DUF6824 domain-containing protein n=1 Tax=Fistulifera solaris TaxID=1519565 RepID=A0A1Z5J8Q4_FISSO|nr:hypothetical protein FisN_3Lh585 [Fistulifera solaris]|eukprot:GAX10370.1 hypothetical protein FisN_3Lh585 [Fistulifera solaris]
MKDTNLSTNCLSGSLTSSSTLHEEIPIASSPTFVTHVRPSTILSHPSMSTTIEPTRTAPQTWFSQPSDHDIVCGRGKSICAHAGNQKFRRMIVARREEYQSTLKRDDKARITAEVVQALCNGPSPSRFLIKDTETDLYREVDMEYAREKVSHALRSRLSTSKMKKKRSVPAHDDEDSDQQKRRRKTPRNNNYCNWTKEEEVQIQMMIQNQQQLLQTLLQP